mmetsp:Transcript_30483/g.76523  ORF Transcript_30483/g.76523 Transcript_30483/m.76523 type:complete len:302 (-) Transcript_30483:187-1092(-)|eukprot:CAMPEP_0177629708 /NCGR_PEP_ID=MMETSP0447-20121125/813_1 /TAXON_ID=0 /ORGANISM="Stygamoeba regulata, Strain BSH-02190019" /LENGTH=301 /DNA_ID=CAMNT_0019131049 /DNA_START=48 /DNA_END=953 /DNA_ORIENTATION=-
MPTLHPDLRSHLEKYRASRAFCAEKWVEEKCQMFNKYMKQCGLMGCVISLSGGVDSAVTFALCIHASKQEDSPIKKVMPVSQPIHSSGWALERAQECADKFATKLTIVDQSQIFDQLVALVEGATGLAGGDFPRGQLRSYMRTPVGYFTAQLLSTSGFPAVVMGTGNMDEDGYLAYFCKAGDGVVDVQLIADLHKSEVFQVAKHLGVPASIVEAAPSADLWAGQTDEDELGFSYDFVELYTGLVLPMSVEEKERFVSSLSSAGKQEFLESEQRAVSVHNRNKHKLNSPHNINVIPCPYRNN